MSNKSQDRSSISFLGNSAVGVTGSAYLIKHKQWNILLDYGLIQGTGNIYSDYQANREQARKFKPKEITSIIISHTNIDHFGMLPYLYSRGCSATAYVPLGCKKFIEVLLADTLKIMQSDCVKIQNKHGKKTTCLYGEADIQCTLSHIVEIPFNYRININQDISFSFLQAGHIQHAASIYLTLKRGSIVKRIYYTGDIGGPDKQLYVEDRQMPDKFDIGILESTYNTPARPNNKKDRENDLNKIVSVVEDYRKVLIPCFAQNRSQVIITEVHRLWEQHKIPNDIKVYFDAPLGIRLSDIWDGEEWQDVWAWKNLIKLTDYAQSQEAQSNREEKCIVVAGAGMCNSGRIVSWLGNYLSDRNTHLLFVGYCPPYGLAHEIKSCCKYVSIDGKTADNNCNYTELRSFSSHASYEELIDFYGEIQGEKYYLVHGDYEPKVEFAKTLQDHLSKLNRSTKVIATNYDTKCYF